MLFNIEVNGTSNGPIYCKVSFSNPNIIGENNSFSDTDMNNIICITKELKNSIAQILATCHSETSHTP